MLTICLKTATGGSAMQAIEVLLSHGVQEEKILFLNLVRQFYASSSISLNLALCFRYLPLKG
jgi:hypothetical protein